MKTKESKQNRVIVSFKIRQMVSLVLEELNSIVNAIYCYYVFSNVDNL